MNVYIPTRGRASIEKQKTFRLLPPRWKVRTIFVVTPEEAPAFTTQFPANGLLICNTLGVPAARQAIVEHAFENTEDHKACMLDDDLRFLRRVPEWSMDDPRLLQSTMDDVDEALHWMEDSLTMYAAVGLGARGNNNSLSDRYVREAGRMMRALAVDAELLLDEDIRFDKYLFWEDFHVTLCLLKLGYPNLISVEHLCDSVQNSEGGVSLYRDIPKLLEVRDRFLEEHAPFAKANDSKSAASWQDWEGDEAPDLRISWRKAFEYGLNQMKE